MLSLFPGLFALSVTAALLILMAFGEFRLAAFVYRRSAGWRAASVPLMAVAFTVVSWYGLVIALSVGLGVLKGLTE